MRPSDIELFAVPRSPALHRDLLLAELTRPDLKSNDYHHGLRKIELGGGERPWTHGERDSSPVISPDGRWVAFLRGTGDDGPLSRPQVHVMPTDGGDARRLTELPLGAGVPVWAPDSRRLAFTARVPEPGRYGTPDGDGDEVEPDEEPPRRITRFDYRLDNIGFLRDRPRRLFVLDALDPAEPEPLTDDQVDVDDPAWTPDGETILVAAPRDWGRSETENSDVYAVSSTRRGEPVLVVRTAGSAANLTVTDDGVLWYIGSEFVWPAVEARNNGLWSVTLPGEGVLAEPRRLTEVESVYCDIGAGGPVFHGDEVLVAVRNRGAVELRAVARDADNAPLDALRLVTGDRRQVTGFAADGGTIVAVVATPETAGEVLVIADGTERVLTDFSGPLRDKGVRPVRELATSAPDGYPVHGWVVLPEGEGPHPVLLCVHGGPFSSYDWGLFDEVQVYASAGYAVVMGNPRGSAGYGESHGRAIVRALGTVDVDDVLALLDVALERPDLDASRVGVMGGSYGGFMTSWLAAHHGERFRAAWSERAVNAWDSFVGSSDIGWVFADQYIGSDVAVQRERSPLTYADKIDIPFLVVHSEQDWRCPVEQAQRMFVALRRGGAEAEMLLFPGEGHELSRSGKPRHRVQRFEAVLEWWGRQLS